MPSVTECKRFHWFTFSPALGIASNWWGEREREREREREIFSLLNLSRKRLRQVFHSNRESEEQKMGKKSMPHWTVTRRAD